MLLSDYCGIPIQVDHDLLAHAYLDAKEYILAGGFGGELDWQGSRSFTDLEEREFLREAAWVILGSGFRESVVRGLFPEIAKAFFGWQSARKISRNLSVCRTNALAIFANRKKIDAICSIITTVASDGFPMVKLLIDIHGLEYLKSLPMIGPITGVHLLKNIGLPVAKPDRHLERIARFTGFASVTDLCMSLKWITGDAIPEVDYVLWRYATLKEDYLRTFHVSCDSDQVQVNQ